MKKVIISVSWAVLIFTSGCQHKPVYPDYGSIYISTDPEGVEVLLDGSITHRITPVKMDGIPTGIHEFTLRANNCKTSSFSIEIKPGQTRMVYQELPPIFLLPKDTLSISAGDMYFMADIGDIYLTNLHSDNITVARMAEDGQLSVKEQIDVGASQRLIAVSSSANKAFFTIDLQGIAGLDLLSHKIIRTIYLKNVNYYSTLVVSPDGNILVAADSLNKRLVLIDSRLCTIIKTINTVGCPTDVSFDKNNPLRIYVTQSGANLFVLINLETGAVINSISTGNSPGAIFWNNYSTVVGFCNRTDRTFTIINVNNWIPATSEPNRKTNFIFDACWSNSDDYMLTAMDNLLGTMFMPSWKQTTRIYNDDGEYPYNLVKVLLSSERKYLLMLNTGQLVTVEMNL